MAAIAYCTNCKANFTDKDEVASIFSGPPHHCLGCAKFAAENPAPEDAPDVSSEALVNDAPQPRGVYGSGQGQGTAANPADDYDETGGASLEHVEGDLLVKPVDAPPAVEPEPEPVPAPAPAVA